MKYLAILAFISLIIFMGIFILEEQLVQKLPEESKFKRWWRNSVIGEMDDVDI
jgi:hypothetical protein